jgi:hypothetical protein
MQLSNSKVYNLRTLDMQLSRVVHVGIEASVQRLDRYLNLPPYALIGASCFLEIQLSTQSCCTC